MKKFSAIIIGGGVAGLMAAYQLADVAHVTLITKNKKMDSNSALAQGGIAAAVGARDDPNRHLADTLAAGHFINHTARTEAMVHAAPQLIKELIEIGVPFEQLNGDFVLGNEGAHSERRILHAFKDQTGKAMTEALWKAVEDKVVLLEHTVVTEIVVQESTIKGVIAADCFYQADVVLIASGGVGQLYQCTSNGKGATGDGFFLAYQAGAVLKDLEFIQFHPTVLRADEAILISEAVRGEGAFLVNEKGVRLLDEFPKKELESRDVVSAVLHMTMQVGESVFLDVRHLPYFSGRFPFIHSVCQKLGLDPANDLIPVEPGAHFMCGGVETDHHGCTAVKGLYAIGEVACTEVHGANRLASNSLLEAVFFAKEAAAHIRQSLSKPKVLNQQVKKYKHEVLKEKAAHSLPTRKELQAMMTRYVGIERTEAGLEQMERWLLSFQSMKRQLFENFEDRCLYELALLVTQSARARKETRGTHRRADFEGVSREWHGKSIKWQKQTIRVEERMYERA